MPERTPADAAVHSLAEDLKRLDQLHRSGRPVAVGEILDALGDRGHGMVALLLAAPMLVLPIPGPGVLIGSVIALLSLAIGLNQPPWLPRRIRRRELPAAMVHRFVQATMTVLQRSERYVRPRYLWVTSGVWHRLAGLSLCLAGIALALPIPIPGNNVPPALGVVVLALGLLERDGGFVLVGHVYVAALWLLLAVLAASAWNLVA